MTKRNDRRNQRTTRLGRRGFLRLAGAATGAGLAFPHIWLKNPAIAQTDGRGSIKHLLYIRLSGGFRFPVAFNADVAAEFNPFGRAPNVADGTEWGVGKLLSRSPFLQGEEGQALRDLGMRPVPALANQMVVIPTVDHEPLAGSADGNHGTGLERYYTGFVDGTVGFFTMLNYGARARREQASEEGKLLLPAFVLGGSGMGRGLGEYAAHRPPVLSGGGFDQFGLQGDSSIPAWATDMSKTLDARMRDRHYADLDAPIDAYIETREATAAYAEIFNSEALKIGNDSEEPIDNVSNRELARIFGDNRAARDVRLALRLFHFGSPGVYLDQGGYDMHSGEESGLPPQMEEINRIVSGLEMVLKRMDHPEGGKYWDHTVVALGSEFSRTARGSRFNSANGSDHAGDLATRWMSMPFFGGPIARPGRRLSETRSSDLKAQGPVYSYRSVLKTLLDGLGADHQDFFPADAPFEDLYV